MTTNVSRRIIVSKSNEVAPQDATTWKFILTPALATAIVFFDSSPLLPGIATASVYVAERLASGTKVFPSCSLPPATDAASALCSRGPEHPRYDPLRPRHE